MRPIYWPLKRSAPPAHVSHAVFYVCLMVLRINSDSINRLALEMERQLVFKCCLARLMKILTWRSEDPGQLISSALPHDLPSLRTTLPEGWVGTSLSPPPPPLTHLILSPSSRFNFIVLTPFICTTDPKSCGTSALPTSPPIQAKKFNFCCLHHESLIIRAYVEVRSTLGRSGQHTLS
jgi:hypothetical protein